MFWSLPIGFMALLVHTFIIMHVVGPEWHVFYNAAASTSLAVFHVITLAILRAVETYDRALFCRTVLQPTIDSRLPPRPAHDAGFVVEAS
jgi:hypothetical protein